MWISSGSRSNCPWDVDILSFPVSKFFCEFSTLLTLCCWIVTLLWFLNLISLNPLRRFSCHYWFRLYIYDMGFYWAFGEILVWEFFLGLELESSSFWWLKKWVLEELFGCCCWSLLYFVYWFHKDEKAFYYAYGFLLFVFDM